MQYRKKHYAAACPHMVGKYDNHKKYVTLFLGNNHFFSLIVTLVKLMDIVD